MLLPLRQPDAHSETLSNTYVCAMQRVAGAYPAFGAVRAHIGGEAVKEPAVRAGFGATGGAYFDAQNISAPVKADGFAQAARRPYQPR